MKSYLGKRVAAAFLLASAVLAGCLSVCQADDANGLFIKPIPAKTVVLTFDDGPLSHYTYVAPLLKSYGFEATFYWTEAWFGDTNYMNWAQVSNLNVMGFEVGNHTQNHQAMGSSSLGTCRSIVMGLENDCLTNGIPKPTTLAYPVYSANPGYYLGLYAKGYMFARGGNELPYHPAVDRPFNVPSFTINDSVTNNFYNALAQATAGQIVVFTFHGVPDIEHPTISVDPTNFAPMMAYLKNNSYNVIAMRDLAQYVGRVNASLTNTPVTGCTSTSAVLNTSFTCAPVPGCAGMNNYVYACWNTVNGGTNAALWTNSAYVGAWNVAPWTNFNCASFTFAGGTNMPDAGNWTNMAPTNLSYTATGLTTNVLYYFTFGVSNDWGRVWAQNVLTFGMGAPTVDNSAGATNLAAGVTQLRGTLSNGMSDVYFYWGATDGGINPANWANAIIVSNQNVGSVAANLTTNPLYGITYYYRCYASNAYHTAWAPATSSFTTVKPATPPPIPANFSFETPVIPTGTRQDLPSGASWAFTGNNECGIDANDGTWWYPEFSPDGRQAVFMFGYTGVPSISQSVTFARAGNYTVSFYAIGRDSAPHGQLNVQIDGADVWVLPRSSTSSDNWQSYTSPPFAVAGGAHTLSIIGAPGDTTSFDDVVLGGAGTVVTLTNAPVTGYAGPSSSSAVINATLSCSNSVYAVYAYWNTVNGGTNPGLWTNSAYIGTWTNVTSTVTVSNLLAGLATNTQYFYTFRATNAADDLWAANVLVLGPGIDNYILSFGQGAMTNVTILGTNITWTVPSSANIAALAPAYTVSPLATGSPASGTTLNFSTPQFYTVTAQNGASQVYKVTVTVVPLAVNNSAGAVNRSEGVTQLWGALASGPADVRIYWGTADGGTNPANWANMILLTNVADGTFSSTVSSLLYGVTYYYRCYASNTYATAWAPATTNFVTLKPGAAVLSVTNGLALWLDAGAWFTMTLNGTNLTEWRDRQGSSAKATLGAGTPALVAAGIGGVPTVHFNSSSWMVDGVNHTAPVTILYVSRQTGGYNGRVLGGHAANWGMGYNGGQKDWYYFGGTGEGSGATSDTQAHLYAATIQGSGSATTFYGNGTSLATNTTANSGPNSLELNGWYTPAQDMSDCDLSEVVLYNRILSSTELNSVGGYLAAKYNLSTAYPPYTGASTASSLTNMAATGIAATSAGLNAALGCAGAVYNLYACWNTVSGGTNLTLWTNSACVGSWTNVASTNLSFTATGLAPSTRYYFTFRATNALDSLWATNVQSFTTLAPPPPPTPVLPVSGVKVTSGVPSFSFTAAASCKYRLDYKNALTDAAWSYRPWTTNTTGSSQPMTLTDPSAAGQPQRFYRLEAANP